MAMLYIPSGLNDIFVPNQRSHIGQNPEIANLYFPFSK